MRPGVPFTVTVPTMVPTSGTGAEVSFVGGASRTARAHKRLFRYLVLPLQGPRCSPRGPKRVEGLPPTVRGRLARAPDGRGPPGARTEEMTAPLADHGSEGRGDLQPDDEPDNEDGHRNGPTAGGVPQPPCGMPHGSTQSASQLEAI